MFYVVGQDVKDRRKAFEEIISREIKNGFVKPPTFVLAKDHFDDFSYKTSFRLFYVRSSEVSSFEVIGDLKILKKGEKTTILNQFVESLDEDFCSVGVQH